jgi:hypothetical protein
MMTGMVQCRHPYNIKKARQQTEEYLRQLAELSSPILEMYNQPAGRHAKAREDIPYFFAWPSMKGEDALDGQYPGAAAPKAAAPSGSCVCNASTATDGEIVLDEGSPGHNVKFDLPSASTPAPLVEAPLPSSPVSTPAAKLRPYLPLRAQKKAGLAPKVGEADVPEDVEIITSADAAAVEEEEEGIGAEGEAEELSEYQRAFVWPDFEKVERAKPLVDKYQPSRVFAKDDLELLAPLRKRGGGATPRTDDRLWSLLTTDLPLPPPVMDKPPTRPDTDQLWDLLEPEARVAPCVVAADGKEGAAILPSPRGRRMTPRAAVSDSTASVAGDMATLSSSGSSRSAAAVARKKRAEVARRQAVAAAVTQVHSAALPSAKSVKAKGRRRKKVAKADLLKPFNPILMNPRYPLLRPAKDVFRSEYAAKFMWPASPTTFAPPF